MTYSSALFTNEHPQSLHDGQLAKYRRILEQLKLSEGARILEIGCGWGGFAEVAAKKQVRRFTGSHYLVNNSFMRASDCRQQNWQTRRNSS